MQKRLANIGPLKVGLSHKQTRRRFERSKFKKGTTTIISIPTLKDVTAKKLKQDTIQENNSRISEENPMNESQDQGVVRSKGYIEKLSQYKTRLLAATRIDLSPHESEEYHEDENEFWLVKNISPARKFPVPITLEIEKFAISYIENTDKAKSPEDQRKHTFAEIKSLRFKSDSFEGVEKEKSHFLAQTSLSPINSKASEHADFVQINTDDKDSVITKDSKSPTSGTQTEPKETEEEKLLETKYETLTTQEEGRRNDSSPFSIIIKPAEGKEPENKEVRINLNLINGN